MQGTGEMVSPVAVERGDVYSDGKLCFQRMK